MNSNDQSGIPHADLPHYNSPGLSLPPLEAGGLSSIPANPFTKNEVDLLMQSDPSLRKQLLLNR